MILANQYSSFQLTFNKVYCLQSSYPNTSCAFSTWRSTEMWSVPNSQERGGAGVPITLLLHISVQGLHLNWEPQSVSTRLEDTRTGAGI